MPMPRRVDTWTIAADEDTDVDKKAGCYRCHHGLTRGLSWSRQDTNLVKKASCCQRRNATLTRFFGVKESFATLLSRQPVCYFVDHLAQKDSDISERRKSIQACFCHTKVSSHAREGMLPETATISFSNCASFAASFLGRGSTRGPSSRRRTPTSTRRATRRRRRRSSASARISFASRVPCRF